MNRLSDFLNKHSYLVLGTLFLIIAVPRIIFPDLDHGDEFSDACVLNAGQNFVKFGFIKCRFLPLHEPHLDKPQGLYTHYPPLPQIFNGLLRIMFRTDSLRFFRGVSLFFSYLNLLLWYLFIKKLTKSYTLGFLAAIFYLTNPLFIFGADSLHQMASSDFLNLSILFIFINMSESQGKKKIRLFILLWVLIVIETLITFEYIVYLSLFFILFRYIFKARESISKTTIFILMLAPTVGFLIHFFQNAWYFGSFSLAFQDLKKVALERIAYSKDAPGQLNFSVWWTYVIVRNFSLVSLFNYFILFLSAFFSYLIYQGLSKEHKKEIKLLLRLLVILVICGISWYILFPSHSYAHTYVLFLARLLMPAASLGFTLFVYNLLLFIKERDAYRLYRRIACFICIFVILFTGVAQSQLPITPSNIKSAKDFLKFKKCLLKLKEKSTIKDEIGLNYYRFPFIRYYTHRHCVTVFDKTQLESMKTLPQYFILMPYNDERSVELLQFIKEKYVPMFQCDSIRFPAIFCEFKK